MKSKFERFSPEWWEWMTMPEPNTGCILWMGCVCKEGYGRIGRGSAGSAVLVHRIAYECAHGPFDRSKHVLHRCDTPSCVNPDHLFIGTQEDNMRDMFAKGRANPRGKKASPVRLLRTVVAPVSAPVAPQMSLEVRCPNVINGSIVHHIRTNTMEASWRHVTGVPAQRPTTAIVPYVRPRLWTVGEGVTGTGTVRLARECRDTARGVSDWSEAV